ncbi:(deoxy)nucleoside triphosphate pyrophosphohydrolase [Pseudonocardia broussonetiae]|nr:NUDIX domain-containing protein [Pseudonocardia broussonetiae]
MPVVRLETLIAAPPRTVAGAVRDATAWAAVFGGVAPAPWLAAGDRVAVGGMGEVLVGRVSEHGMTAAGPGIGLAVVLTPDGAGTRMRDEVTGDVPEHLLAVRAAAVAQAAGAMAAAQVVVATALVHDGRVLAARRTRPPALAGLWELPGGRVEAGESEAEAVVRECREELGTAVVVGERIATDLRIDAGVLRVHTARLADGAPQPRALEHAGLRWVAAGEVAAVDWVGADRAVVADLVALLG